MESDNNNETPGVRPLLFRNDVFHSEMKKIGPP